MMNDCTHIEYGERLAAEYAEARQQYNVAIVAGDSRWANEGTLHANRVMRALKRNAATHAAECEGAADDD